MTLQEIAQILGGIGVIASLIYVAIQIRNNACAVRAATYLPPAAASNARPPPNPDRPQIQTVPQIKPPESVTLAGAKG